MAPLWFVALEWFTVIVTILVTTSGLPACVKMYQTKSTDNVPFALFLVYAFVSTLSVQYGLILNNNAMILVNSVALLIWIAYISVFVLVTSEKANAFMKASAVLFLYWAHLHYLATLPQENVLPTLGIYMVVWCTILSLLPCADIMEMIRTKSCACCDMPMLCAGSLSCITWILYGWAIGDANIFLSSVPGVIVNMVKFVLVFMYPDSKPREVPAVEKRKARRDAKQEEDSNGNIVTDFHEEVYNVKPRNSLYKKAQ